MVVTAGAMAVGGGDLTVVSLRVVESVTMLLVWAQAGVAAMTAVIIAHLPRLVILLLIFHWIGFANLLHVFLCWNIKYI